MDNQSKIYEVHNGVVMLVQMYGALLSEMQAQVLLERSKVIGLEKLVKDLQAENEKNKNA